MTPAEAARLQPGDRVVYRCGTGAARGSGVCGLHGPPEEGTVVRVAERFVFVCYGLPGSTPKATDPRDLERT